VLFGLVVEAGKNYRLAFWVVAKHCGFPPLSNGVLSFPSIRIPWTKLRPNP
jgi:hypothetical protein